MSPLLPIPPQWILLRRRLRLLAQQHALHGRAWLAFRRRIRRGAVGIALGVVLGSCLAGAWAAMLARSVPGWWVTVRREDPVVVTLANNIENRFMSRVNQNRISDAGGAVWTIDIPATDANAWLNVRLPKWLANQKDQFRWPKEMSDLQVNFCDNRITIGAKVRSGERDQVLTATIEPRLAADGRLYIPARWVSLGRLSIPADWVLDQAHKNATQYIPPNLRDLPETEALFGAFAGDQAIRNNTTIRLLDGRQVRILAFSATADTLRVTCRTERRQN